MRKLLLQVFGILVIGLFLSACTRSVPILKVDNALIPAGLSQQQIEQAIIAGAKDKGWYAVVKKSGLIVATLHYKTMFVEVNIPYSDKIYSINYVTSKGLHESDGQISYYYTRWVKFLNDKIQMHLNNA